ncbi:MAG TPA: aldo/keto reductase, partial [Chthoniobacterales bacterium]
AVYGLGHSEELVAKALATWEGPKPYVFTKCGMIWDVKGEVDYSLKAESIRLEVENSLRRLKVDAIDLYQIHWPADDLNETLEGWTELARLKAAGKLRHIGVSNFTLEELHQAYEIAPITSLQPPYSLISRSIEDEILPWTMANGVGVIVYSPMGSGLLAGKMTRERALSLPRQDWRSRNLQFQEPQLSKNLALADRLAAIGKKHGASAGEVAIAWTLKNTAVTAAIAGARDAYQVEGNIGGADLTLTLEEIAEIEAQV